MKLLFSSLTQLCIYFATLIAILGNAVASQAQITPDSTVNTQVNQNGSVAEITGGETRGNNLFHSFQDFSVGNGSEAFFNNAASIDNILSRVTGGNISQIDGLIRANGSANLFLINPAGIVFGEGASLDLGGSFYGSSASKILFESGEFSAADLDNPPLLTVNAPIGLGFRDNPGDITLDPGSKLSISPTETLALVGGNITVDGGIMFPNNLRQLGASFELGGLTEAGTVDIAANGSLNFPDNIVRGDVSLINGSFINAFSEGEGEVLINARNFNLNSNARIINGILSATSDAATTQSGDIAIDATEDVVINGADSQLVTISNDVVTTGVGRAGQIAISGRNISLINGGTIFSTVANTPDGKSSDVTLTAKEDIIFSGTEGFSSSGISNLVFADRSNGGEINLTADNLTIESGASIDTSSIGMGNSSNINISVNDTVSIDGRSSRIETSLGEITAELQGTGKGGNIILQTTNLSISNDGRIVTSIAGQGEGGNIVINADDVAIDGDDSEISSETALDLPDEEANQNDAGNIRITTNALAITNAAELSTSSNSIGDGGDISITARDSVLVSGTRESGFGFPSNINSDAGTSIPFDVIGNAGDIKIVTPRLIVSDEAFISASVLAEGNSGNLTILASESVEVSNDAVIQAEVFEGATGNSGNLDIETANLTVSNGAQISASTRGNGDAGNLTVKASDSISITGGTETGPSALLATALVESGNSGELNVTTQDLTVSDDAVVSVGNFPALAGGKDPGTGKPGNLNIQAASINLDGGSIEAATQSPSGAGANINLQVAEGITLRSNGLISAKAVNQGNGGNLNIDTDFIVAFADGNNDIIASAERGQGGNININAEGVFGIQERPQSSSTNDIDASSEVLGFDGNINIETLDFNPLQGMIEIVTRIVESEQTASQACRTNRQEIATKGNGLTITGKGGVVPAPDLPLSPLNIPTDEDSTLIASETKAQAVSTSYGDIVPAMGAEITEDGRVILTADAANNEQHGYKGLRNCGVLY